MFLFFWGGEYYLKKKKHKVKNNMLSPLYFLFFSLANKITKMSIKNNICSKNKRQSVQILGGICLFAAKAIKQQSLLTFFSLFQLCKLTAQKCRPADRLIWSRLLLLIQ